MSQSRTGRLFAALALAGTFAPAAIAQELSEREFLADYPSVNVIDTRKVKPDQFGQVAEMVHEQMQPDGRFGEVSNAERAEVSALLDEMQQIVAGMESIKDLDEDQRVALINAQVRANEILAKRDGDRLICKRRLIVGSHRRETFCVKAWDQQRRDQYSNDLARENDRRARVCTDTFSGCKGAAAGGQ